VRVVARIGTIIIIVDRGLGQCGLARSFLDVAVELLGATTAKERCDDEDGKSGGRNSNHDEHANNCASVLEERLFGSRAR